MAVTIDGNLGILSPDFEPSGSTVPTNGLFLPTTNTLAWATNSSEKLRLDSSGNMGLGVTPSGWVSTYKVIQLNTTGSVYCNGGTTALNENSYFNGTSNLYLTSTYATRYLQNNGQHVWYNAPSGTAGNAISFTQAMTLDASGNLGIGITSPAFKLHVGGYSNVNSANKLAIGDSVDYQARLYMESATETFTIENTSDYANSAILFRINGSERARFDSSGNLLVGTTSSPVGNARFRAVNATSDWSFGPNNGSSFLVYNASSVGVYIANGATSWTATSDERLKTDLKPIENAAQKVSSLRAVTGRFKTDEESVSRSFLIAQDVQAVLPEAVDAEDPEKLGVRYTDTIPLLVAAIKELTARLEALEAK